MYFIYSPVQEWHASIKDANFPVRRKDFLDKILTYKRFNFS